MSLERYAELSKVTGKTIIVMVRGDLAAHAEVETKDLQTKPLGDMIVQILDEAIKDKEEHSKIKS